jgi:hypothetical protein
MATCNASELLAAAKCFSCLTKKELRAITVQLLCNISDSGGGVGGGFQNLTGNGSPVGVETPDYVGQYYTDFNTPGSIWVATGLTNADWRCYIGNY